MHRTALLGFAAFASIVACSDGPAPPAERTTYELRLISHYNSRTLPDGKETSSMSQDTKVLVTLDSASGQLVRVSDGTCRAAGGVQGSEGDSLTFMWPRDGNVDILRMKGAKQTDGSVRGWFTCAYDSGVTVHYTLYEGTFVIQPPTNVVWK